MKKAIGALLTGGAVVAGLYAIDRFVPVENTLAKTGIKVVGATAAIYVASRLVG